MPKKTIAKSAKTGQIVSKEFAKENPDTTFETETKPKAAFGNALVVDKGSIIKIGRGELHLNNTLVHPPFVPEIGDKFDLHGEIASVVSFDPLTVTIHEIVGGCQSERVKQVESLDGAFFLDRDEAFRRLAG